MKEELHNEKKFIIILASIIGLCVLVTVGYGFYLHKSVTDLATEIHEDWERLVFERREAEVDLDEKEPLSF